MKFVVTIVMLIALLLHAISAQAAAAKQPPNILFITCDNLGYGDLPCYNPKSNIQAPHLDRLASPAVPLVAQVFQLDGFFRLDIGP